ncbi:reverse transcriptase family protein [Vibrio alginolyticus]|uniref:reverse transcriptase family protein n=1 Tax=Vibrio alginolyticus TaxID=663 RepID=UPI00215BD6AE|nr:reverse transcriptase family protein [Vibrio alginolyticus]EKL9827750.1 RNA-directed DNA polymerase [Vibrio alginolyticus]MCR9491285.1 reverse transcriptase family protein [Vibrio alginolyticus]
MRNLLTPLSKKASPQEDLLSLFQRWLTSRPEFDTKALQKQNCWPITEQHYKLFTVEKRNGTARQLVTVDKQLKSIQRNLLQYFEQNYDVSQYAYGFVRGTSNFQTNTKHLRTRGVVTNALAHTNKKLVISLDLENFFPSITFPRVMGLLKSKPFDFSNKQSAILASLVCLPKAIDEKRGLPQGSPTSPIISNLICKKLDYQLGNMARKYDLVYTRYADDLTISTNNLKKISAHEIISIVQRHVERNGFKINREKTKVMYRNQRQMVTGIIVNEGLNLPKKQVDALKATLHNLEHVYKDVDEAVKDINKNNYDSFAPIGYYRGGYKGRYIRSISKGKKSTKPTSDREFNYIYSRHILGRVLWYGQVVTTGINTPYDLSNRKYISPKQYSRIIKFEEMLSSLYRISIKFNWSMENIIFRFSNKLSHLQSSVKMTPELLLEPIEFSTEEIELNNRFSKLKKNHEECKKFFDNSPATLQRALIVENRSRSKFSFNSIKKCIESGWYIPAIQQEVFKELDNGQLSDLFHKSSNEQGHNVHSLLLEIVKIVKPRIRYLSEEMKDKILIVHKELLKLMRSDGDSVCIEYGKDSPNIKFAIQAISDLKLSTRLYEDDTDNFYNRIVLDAVKRSGTENLVNIDRLGMEARIVTDINAWRDSIFHILISIKQHADKSELNLGSPQQKPYTIRFRDEHPITHESRAVEVYRLNINLPFKKKLDIEQNTDAGVIDKWLTGRDLLLATRKFMPIGDIYVHGNFIDCDNFIVNLTEHSYIKEENIINERYGKLFISLQEIKK